MRHRFLFATDDRIAGLVSRFVLHLGEPMCLLAIMSNSDKDIKDYTKEYHYRIFESEYGIFTVAFMPFKKWTSASDPTEAPFFREAFDWYISYLDNMDELLFIDPGTIVIDGKEYEIYTRRENGHNVYNGIVNGFAVWFEPNENGDIYPVLKDIPEDQHDLLLELGRKIESQLL
jgi:hypothetical protein